MKTGSDDGGREQFDLGEDDEDYNETDDKGFAAYSKATQGQRQQLLRRALGVNRHAKGTPYRRPKRTPLPMLMGAANGCCLSKSCG
jgi:hypothetical protein